MYTPKHTDAQLKEICDKAAGLAEAARNVTHDSPEAIRADLEKAKDEMRKALDPRGDIKSGHLQTADPITGEPAV